MVHSRRELDGKAGVSLGGPKYAEYEIASDRPLVDFVYDRNDIQASLKSNLPRGSAGVGEPVRSVKSEPSAEWVRFPPPPSQHTELPGLEYQPRELSKTTRLSKMRRIYIPVRIAELGGLTPGGLVNVRSDGWGRVTLEPTADRKNEGSVASRPAE